MLSLTFIPVSHTFLPDLDWCQPQLAPALKCLQFYGQPVAVPARDIVDTVSTEHVVTINDVLQYLKCSVRQS
ncbi:hypothetical protein DPMN_090689 [Dreissena polymorpha]|uniref:Uncharacterized protein n=1 Tax=Dreissena polymorpha TaxID=45954 RepID=A0A9D4KZ70_DREPO|nr:hypothetical protein DPMN_090689 [Dreissena polymorpha]